MVVGMPNVGKSSLINLLRGKATSGGKGPGRGRGGGGGGEGAKQVRVVKGARVEGGSCEFAPLFPATYVVVGVTFQPERTFVADVVSEEHAVQGAG